MKLEKRIFKSGKSKYNWIQFKIGDKWLTMKDISNQYKIHYDTLKSRYRSVGGECTLEDLITHKNATTIGYNNRQYTYKEFSKLSGYSNSAVWTMIKNGLTTIDIMEKKKSRELFKKGYLTDAKARVGCDDETWERMKAGYPI